MSAAFAKALDIAESLGDREYQLRALSGLQYYHTWSGRYRTALSFAERFHDLAIRGSDRYDRLFGERTLGVTKHHLGELVSARHHLEQALDNYSAADHRLDFIRFRSELRVSARVFLARALWFSRALFGYWGFRIRRCAPLSRASVRRVQPATQTLSVWLLLWQPARLRCGRET